MRLIEGRSLEAVITDGPLDPARAVTIVEQVGSRPRTATRSSQRAPISATAASPSPSLGPAPPSGTTNGSTTASCTSAWRHRDLQQYAHLHPMRDDNGRGSSRCLMRRPSPSAATVRLSPPSRISWPPGISSPRARATSPTCVGESAAWGESGCIAAWFDPVRRLVSIPVRGRLASIG